MVISESSDQMFRVENSEAGGAVALIVAPGAPITPESANQCVRLVRDAGVTVDDSMEVTIGSFITLVSERKGPDERRLELGAVIPAKPAAASPVRDEAARAPALELDGVSGSATCDGDALVRGGVEPESRFRVHGSARIMGRVEAATIEALGDVAIEGGMVGRGEGVIQTGGSVSAKYLDAVRVEAGEDVRVEREAIGCEMTVLGSLASPKGAIIGGVCAVVGTVDVRTLGSPSATPTRLVLGTVPSLEPLHERLLELTEELEAQCKKMEQELEKLNMPGRRLKPEDKERQTELSFMTHTNRARVVRCRTLGLHCTECIRSLRTVRVLISEKLCAGVSLVIGSQEFFFGRDLEGPIRITRTDRGEVRFQRSVEDEPVGLSSIGGVKTRASRVDD